ncbi:DUF2971 domain-containing protein [Enterobacter kobei]|uniref:DUF2971 domain-containing protein n=1 Tax=Enterobacter kobei TaxID=208224 RepID=UPI00210B1CC3|nr:DUF2971 domain-containing protein [Enterobacter kobei]MCQ4413356.1 DUF2971 domain-containing protein [Enterobacter kobei]HDC4298833.1 DUF2971 domain-containing protein [Enterobacter kobei]
MNKAIPSVLYKYKEFNINSLDSLINDTVYLADPVSFNDPFDCQPSVVDDLRDINVLRDIATELMLDTQSRDFASSRNEVMKFIQYQYLAKNPISHEMEDDMFIKASEQLTEYKKSEYKNFQEAEKDLLIDDIQITLSLMEDCTETDSDRTPDIEMYNTLINKELVKSRNKGVLSLAKNHDCPLMWAHYADDHQGFCCGYRLPGEPEVFANKNNIKAVDYEGERKVLTSELYQLVQNLENIKSTVDDTIFYVKAENWKYEHEYRMIGKPGLRKSPFILESIYFGLRCKDSVKFSIMSALANRDSTVQFYQMKEVKGTFDLKPEPITLTDLTRLPRN